MGRRSSDFGWLGPCPCCGQKGLDKGKKDGSGVVIAFWKTVEVVIELWLPIVSELWGPEIY